MKVTGKHNELQKEKAFKEASEIITALRVGNARKVLKKTQLSWRTKKTFLFGLLKLKKKAKNLFVPEFDLWEIKQIHFHSPVMIDVVVKLDNQQAYRIRMIAEKKPYITHPGALFRFNPNSLRKVDY